MLSVSWAPSTVPSTLNALCYLIDDLLLCAKCCLGSEIGPRKASVGIPLVKFMLPEGHSAQQRQASKASSLAELGSLPLRETHHILRNIQVRTRFSTARSAGGFSLCHHGLQWHSTPDKYGFCVP